MRRGKAKNIFKTTQILIEKTVLLCENLPSPPAPLPNTPRSSSLGEGSNQLVYGSSDDVLSQYGYMIPDTIEEMVKLPGVGIKTAKVVLYVLYKQRWVAVDTHVHRVMNRLGVVHTKTPEQTSKQLEKIIPDDYKDIAHHVIIYFGRYLCKAKKPECERCPLTSVCEWYKAVNG